MEFTQLNQLALGVIVRYYQHTSSEIAAELVDS